MRYPALFVVLYLLAAIPGARAANSAPGDNASIDIDAYLRVAAEAAAQRESHRLSQVELIRMSREPGTTILDARGGPKYQELHIKGAINLSFAAIASANLQRVLPGRYARILIYCNNNFENAPGPFPSKLPSAALNISTYIALYDYGYRNVYELGPLIDVNATELQFESTAAP